MAASFSQPYELTKNIYNGGYPKELDSWSYDHHATPASGTCITGYSLSGDVPLSISVDGSGTISGTLAHFGKQPSCQNNKQHKEAVLDGSTWNDNGRFKPDLYAFKFTITVYWKEKDSEGNSCKVSGSTSKSCLLVLKKYFSVDNKIFKDDYESKGFEIGKGKEISPIQSI